MTVSLSSLTLFHPGMSAMVAPRITSCFVYHNISPGLVDEAHSVFEVWWIWREFRVCGAF